MSKKERRLGRGMDVILGHVDATPDPPLGMTTGGRPMTREIPVGAIAPNPNQPRTEMDPQRLDELAESIRASGIIQPVVVRPHDGGYQLVVGERRWRAAQRIGLATVPAVVRDVNDQQMTELALIENIQREDLNPIDRAAAYRDYCARFNVPAEALAGHLGIDRTTVVNYIRLLDLPVAVQQLVRENRLSMGHARGLLGLSDPAVIERLALQSVADGFSVRRLEALVRSLKEGAQEPEASEGRGPRPKRPLIADLEQRFAEALGTRVTIREGRKKNTGKITIEYYSLDDFDRITERLGVPSEEV